MKEKENLFKRDFTLVVIGQTISLFGNAILRFALPLYLLRETGSSTLFGIVTACSFAPMVVLSMIGGVLADRVNKRNIMVGLDFCTAILVFISYLTLGKLPTVSLFIVVLMLLYGISGTYQPSVQASDENGDVKQRITIYYKFVGSLNKFYILTPTKRWTAISDRVCECCGAAYTPKAGAAKYCPACSKEIHRQQSNESKRRSRAKTKAKQSVT